MKLRLLTEENSYAPNLFTNGDFKINQRGQSVYVFGEYSADMWFCTGDSFGWNKDGVTFYNVWQKLKPLPNGKYMFSYRKYNELEQKYISLSSNNATADDGYLQVSIQTDSSYSKVIIQKKGGGQVDRLRFVRLNEGSVKQKHIEEDYDEAIFRCFNHVVVFENQNNAIGVGLAQTTSATEAVAIIQLPAEMSGIPNVLRVGNWSLKGIAGVNKVKKVQVSKNILYLTLEISNSVADIIRILTVNEGSKMIITSEPQ